MTTFTSQHLTKSVLFRDADKLEISLFSATIMKIAYDIDVQESNDPYILVAEEAIKGMHVASIPGSFLVDLFPMLKFVPSWFPGAGFQVKAAYWKKVTRSMVENPFRYVEEQLVVSHSFERYRTFLNGNSTEKWQCWAIHSSKPH